jgi:hypothetical protein
VDYIWRLQVRLHLKCRLILLKLKLITENVQPHSV